MSNTEMPIGTVPLWFKALIALVCLLLILGVPLWYVIAELAGPD